MYIKYMVDKCKEIGCFVDKPSQKDLDNMYQKISSSILRLNNNKKYKLFS